MADRELVEDKSIEFPTRRLTKDEIEDLAKTQAAGKIARKSSRRGPKPKKVVFVDSKGYPRVSLRNPKLRDKRLHVLIAEAMLGRELLPSEEAHHKDGNYLNFHWENILIIHTEDHGAVSSRQKYYFKVMGVTVDKLKHREPGEDDDDY